MEVELGSGEIVEEEVEEEEEEEEEQHKRKKNQKFLCCCKSRHGDKANRAHVYTTLSPVGHKHKPTDFT
ncbi:hypothetical protein SRHO_G00089830 [Serrasalmus rhombeus]